MQLRSRFGVSTDNFLPVVNGHYSKLLSNSKPQYIAYDVVYTLDVLSICHCALMHIVLDV